MTKGMDRPLIRFVIPAEFISSHSVRLLPAEIAFGFRAGWLDSKGAVDIATAQLASGERIETAVEALALVLPDEYYTVPDLIASIEASCPSDNAAEVWKFLAIAAIRAREERIEDTYSPIAGVAADFGYPHDLDRLVHYMPVASDETPGAAYMQRNIDGYLRLQRAKYVARR